MRKISSTILSLFILSVFCFPQLSFSESKKEKSNSPKEITVVAASDLKFVLPEIISEFQKSRPDVTVKPIFGSSGNFFAQISSKAPFDLFLSADIDYPRKLIDQGLGVKNSDFMYAIGRIVVWVPKTSKINVTKEGIKSLLDPSIKKIAIANPEHAPYGRAAEAAMKKANIYDKIKDRLVLGENITQTAQYVETGAADIGIIALSLAVAPAMKDKGSYFEIPLDSYPKMEQGGMITSYTTQRESAEALREFLLGKQSRAIFDTYGFLLPTK